MRRCILLHMKCVEIHRSIFRYFSTTQSVPGSDSPTGRIFSGTAILPALHLISDFITGPACLQLQSLHFSGFLTDCPDTFFYSFGRFFCLFLSCISNTIPTNKPTIDANNKFTPTQSSKIQHPEEPDVKIPAMLISDRNESLMP